MIAYGHLFHWTRTQYKFAIFILFKRQNLFRSGFLSVSLKLKLADYE